MINWFYLIDFGMVSILLLFWVRYAVKNQFPLDVFSVVFYLFNFFFVLPELVLLLFGGPKLGYAGYNLIISSLETNIVWLTVVVILYLFHYYIASVNVARKSPHFMKRGFRNINNEMELPPIGFLFVASLGVMLPTICAIFSPEPALYFQAFAPLYRPDDYNVSLAVYDYHSDYMNMACKLGMISVLILWIYSVKRKIFFLRIALVIIAVEILLFSNKRTLGSFLIVTMLLIDNLSDVKFKWKKNILVLLGVIFYFILYHAVAKSQTSADFIDDPKVQYHLYFARVIDLKLVIFSLLNPEILPLLDYPCQSLIHDVLYWVPRDLWEDKPYPFGRYYSAALKGHSLEAVNGLFLTSYWSEMIANLAWWGLPIGGYLYYKLLKLVDQARSSIVYVLGYLMLLGFEVTHIASNYWNLTLLFVLYVCLEKRRGKNEMLR